MSFVWYSAARHSKLQFQQNFYKYVNSTNSVLIAKNNMYLEELSTRVEY